MSKFEVNPCKGCDKIMSPSCWEECIMLEELEKTNQMIGFGEDDLPLPVKPKKKKSKPKIDVNKFFEI